MAFYTPFRALPRLRPRRGPRGDYVAFNGGTYSTNFQAAPMAGGTVGGVQGAIGTGVGEYLGGLLGLPTGLGGLLGNTFLAPELPGGSQTQAERDSPYIPNILERPLEAALDIGAGGRKRRRSMNPANVGALRRALRRVDSFRNLAKKSGALPAAKRLPQQRACRSTCK